MTRLEIAQHLEIVRNEYYNCFTSAAKLADGSYMIAFRQAADWQHIFGVNSHVDPASIAVFVTSQDGIHWDGKPQLLHDDYFYGVMDPALTVLKDGTIFCTFFIWKVLEKEDVEDHSNVKFYIHDRYIHRYMGVHSIRSTDNGKTWDAPQLVSKHLALRGKVLEQEDGSLLAAAYGNLSGGGDTSVVTILRSPDRGQTWSEIGSFREDAGYHLFEPAIYQTEAGKMVCFMRTMKREVAPGEEGIKFPIFMCESLDGGVTWSKPRATPLFSPNPPYLLRLRSGNVMMAYGYRLKPYGIRAVIMNPECSDIDTTTEIVLRDDGGCYDLGYTGLVEVEDGQILVSYYYSHAETGPWYIGGTLVREVTS
ncbi:sialidase family protein [Paenibacillus cymbidii]|uniref:sialidase family protein n=1 Tax=Paenibacillus cymbidii TaxID=1639034 RepID=UPI00108135F2|nr:sialidase family protein [Paenibacillus cymbidii]